MLFLLCVVFIGLQQLSSIEASKHKECSPFPHVQVKHGRITRTGSQRYSFTCDKGFFLASPSKVRCYKGNWTSIQQPKCLKIEGTCIDPPKVANAVLYGDDRNIGDSVTYVCDPGYVLLGNGQLTCAESGYWNGRTPTCMDESEPIQKVAERLKESFVNEVSQYSDGTPQGRLLDRASLLKGLEMVMLIDRSSSLDPVDLEVAKNFVKFLMRRFGVKNTSNKSKLGTRVAVIAFGTDVQMIFNVDDKNITGPDAANKAVDTIEPNGGGTNMEDALQQVVLQVEPELRPQAKRALFLMTDGEPTLVNPHISPQEWAMSLKTNYGFEIFTVGIGKGINRKLLSELASEPPLSHVFILSQYPDLNEVMKVIEDDQPPEPPISKDQCGYDDEEEDEPWLSVLYVTNGEGPMKLCGGVLICSQWVLTTASCLQHGENPVVTEGIFITMGERDLLKDERNQTNFYAIEVKVHPGYDQANQLKYNLALVQLNMPAEKYRPVCLPRTDQTKPLHLNLNLNASIAGWGLSGEPEISVAEGASIRFGMDWTPVELAEEHECPGNQKGMALFCAGHGTQTCLGLMGSPLIAVDPSTGYNHVLGLVNGRKHCLKGHNQYVELTRHIRWINQETVGCHLKHWGIKE